MTDQIASHAATLRTIITRNQDKLVERILHRFRRQGYNRHSLSEETRKRHIAALSAALLALLENGVPGGILNPREDYADDPLAGFATTLADGYREDGATLESILRQMKIYRQGYLDLIDHKSPAPADRLGRATILHRFFDRMEIGLCNRLQLSGTPNSPYSTIVQNLRSPVAVLDQNNRIDTVNRAWENLFPRPERAAGDRQADTPINQPQSWMLAAIDEFTSADKDQETVEKPVHTAIGNRRLSITLKRLRGADGVLGGCIVILDDVTRRKRIESALQETTIWLTEMFKVLEEAVFIATPGGRIVDVNAAAGRIFGYDAAELKNRTTERLHVDHEHFKSFAARVKAALGMEGNTAFEYVGKRKNGEIFPVHVKITLLWKKDRKPLGIVCVVRDISTQKLAEEATRSSERLQGALELAGAVCHDLNQPLMAITGYAELILMDCPENAPYTDKVNKILRQAAKMGGITKKLMHVTRYETKAYMDKQIIDIEKASDRS